MNYVLIGVAADQGTDYPLARKRLREDLSEVSGSLLDGLDIGQSPTIKAVRTGDYIVVHDSGHDSDSRFFILNAEDGTLVTQVNKTIDTIAGMAVHPDGASIYAAQSPGTIGRYNPDGSAVWERSVVGAGDPGGGIALHPDGSFAASLAAAFVDGSQGWNIAKLDPADGSVIATSALEVSALEITASEDRMLAIDPNGNIHSYFGSVDSNLSTLWTATQNPTAASPVYEAPWVVSGSLLVLKAPFDDDARGQYPLQGFAVRNPQDGSLIFDGYTGAGIAGTVLLQDILDADIYNGVVYLVSQNADFFRHLITVETDGTTDVQLIWSSPSEGLLACSAIFGAGGGVTLPPRFWTEHEGTIEIRKAE